MKKIKIPETGGNHETPITDHPFTDIVFSASYVFTADKVVVIHLESSNVAGSNKQVQYNDNGKIAGARMYYDKSNQRFGVSTNLPEYLFHVKASKSGSSGESMGKIELRNYFPYQLPQLLCGELIGKIISIC